MNLDRKQLARELAEAVKTTRQLREYTLPPEELFDSALQLLEIRHNGKISLHDA